MTPYSVGRTTNGNVSVKASSAQAANAGSTEVAAMTKAMLNLRSRDNSKSNSATGVFLPLSVVANYMSEAAPSILKY
jgi:uncharacterized membrane protein YccC